MSGCYLIIMRCPLPVTGSQELERQTPGAELSTPGLWAEGVVDMGFVIRRCFSDRTG